MHDVSIPAALIAGLVSFLSPCVLPLVPPYLIYLTGATIEHVANDETTQTSKRAVMAFPPSSWRSAPAPPWSAG
jgi:cytochrome c-type biogenesis protein